MKIEHVALYVKDLEQTKLFFEKYFKAKSGKLYYNPQTEFKSYFLTFDDATRLEIMYRPAMETVLNALRNERSFHLAFSLGSKEKVNELTLKLKTDGYEVISGPRITGDGYTMKAVLGMLKGIR